MVPVHTPSPAFAPAAPQERIETLDIVRGVALFAILAVNWTVNAHWDNDAWEGFSGVADQLAWWTMHVLLDEKARPMFTFMFGLGFAILIQRAEDRGAPYVAKYARRLAVLFVIGVAHDILTERDILWGYAIFGFLLLPVRKLDPKLLVALALLWVLVPFAMNATRSRGYSDYVERLTSRNNARTVVTLEHAVLDAYVGEYEFDSAPYGIFVTRMENTLLGQSPGVPGFDDLPFRLFAISETEFFSRSIEAAEVSFVKDSTGAVTGIVWQQGREVFSGRMVRPGAQAIDDAARKRVAGRAPEHEIYATGSFAEIVRFRAPQVWRSITSYTRNFRSWLNPDFAIFLLGLYAGRRRIFHEITAHSAFTRKVMWWTLAVGLTGAAIELFLRDALPGAAFRGEPVSYMTNLVRGLAGRLGDPALGLAYIASLTVLLERKVWKSRLGPLGAVGRMSLTNYLLQSVAFVLIFFGYGLGWWGQTGAFTGLVLATALFVLQIVASQWWMRRFRFGPAEWLLRTATYAKLQPMRVGQSQKVG